MKLQLLQKHEKVKTQLLWVPRNKIRETYVMKRPVRSKKRAFIKNDIRRRGLKDALEVTPSKARGFWDLTGGKLRKDLLTELFKAHEPLIYRPTGQRITEGKIPVITTLVPLQPYEAHLSALRDNLDRRTVTMLQVGDFVSKLLQDEKLPWRSAERRERIQQIAMDLDVDISYVDKCVNIYTNISSDARKDGLRGKFSHRAIKSLSGLAGRPKEQNFLYQKMKKGIPDDHVARMAAIMKDLPPGEATNARMEDMAKTIAEAPTLGVEDIMTLPFIKDAGTMIPKVVALTCTKGHTFTHILCPTCLEEQIKDKSSCAACPACNDQSQLSTLTPRVHITMSSKELEKRLISYMQNRYGLVTKAST